MHVSLSYIKCWVIHHYLFVLCLINGDYYCIKHRSRKATDANTKCSPSVQCKRAKHACYNMRKYSRLRLIWSHRSEYILPRLSKEPY